MKRIVCLLLVFIMVLGFSACGNNATKAEEPKPTEEKGGYSTFEYTHYASGGTPETYDAVILFEQSNSTFTAYQVAYSSCTCRNALVNYYMVCYVEILNTKSKPELAAIRDITCLDNKGVWGDSNPNYYIAEYTEDYMNEHLVKSFIGVNKDEIDKFEGYGTWIEPLPADALSGATVSSSNMQSMLKGLMDYHVEKYYK
ncbi:MAG: hypothetical protein MJ150_03220 [Clostridia bacterium]|nr:hypothetical protein [Clostridia bacterium]